MRVLLNEKPSMKPDLKLFSLTFSGSPEFLKNHKSNVTLRGEENSALHSMLNRGFLRRFAPQNGNAGLCFSFLCALLLSCSSFLQAQSAVNGSATPLRFVTSAIPAPALPTLDGDVRNDPAYMSAVPLTEFWQTAPDEGQPASERTEVRIVQSRDTLYIGVICYDRNPQELVVSENRRDASLADMDAVLILLDTYKDGQNGFIFGTNPAGNEYDAQVTYEGELSVLAMRSGSTGGFNLNWDGSWVVRTKVGDFGWSAEFAIPFRTLRYGSGNPQTWGLNIQRNIRRRKETAYWAKLPRQFNLNKVSLAGTLEGIEVPTPQNLKLIPYLLGNVRRSAADPRSISKGEAGLDLKYSLTPSLTLDATYNTDFAQVEVDEQQVNLDRFDLFFPEKRPFFLENAGVFDVGSPGEVELFFSRRIGIGPNGIVVPIVGGGRISGKVGDTKVGLLNMQTEKVEGITPANNFTAARVNHELPNRSSVGALFVNRQGGGSFNRTAAVDGRWGIGPYTLLGGYAARTFTPGLGGEQYGYKVGIAHNDPGWIFETHYTEVGANFNPEVGFLRRRAYRKSESVVLHRFRPKDFIGLQEMRPHISYRGFWNFSGFQETGFLHLDSHWEFKSGHEIHTGINFKTDGVVTSFAIYPGIVVPSGTYRNVETQIVLMTNKAAWMSLDATTYYGGLFSGTYLSTSPTIRIRSGDQFNVQLTWSYNDVRLQEGNFTTNIIRTRISYSFTPAVFVQGLFQYNDLLKNFSTNLRFGWIQTSNTGLFLVINQNSSVDGSAVGFKDRSVVVKYSRLFDLLD